jgi:hypothetical protein
MSFDEKTGVKKSRGTVPLMYNFIARSLWYLATKYAEQFNCSFK